VNSPADQYCSGTSIAFIGALRSSSSQRPTVTIDDEMVFNTINFNDTENIYRQWFQSPTLVDGFHSVTVANCSNRTILDFAAVKVGTRSNLTQSTIIVDNESPSISYSGHWSRNTSELTSGSYFSGGYPYGNSTHRSSTPGDTFTFRFTGKLGRNFQGMLTSLLVSFFRFCYRDICFGIWDISLVQCGRLDCNIHTGWRHYTEDP